MLAQKSYPTEYVASCRELVAGQIASYGALGLTPAQAAAFEPGYAQVLVLALDHLFTHRMRGQEGNGVLHDVRELCDDIRQGRARVLGVDDVAKLADAFLDEIEDRFPA